MNENLSITKLGLDDIENMLALQNKILNNLPEDQKYFIVERKKSDLLVALSSENMHVFGIYVGKTLVAQSILNFPKDDAPRDIPEFAQNYKNSEIAIFQAILVDPAYRGVGLMKRMLQVREDMAVLSGKKIAICKIAADNSFSWQNALKHGMRIMKAGIDKSGQQKLYLQKSLKNLPQSAIQAKYVVKPNTQSLKNIMLNMSKLGWVGLWDGDAKALAYVSFSPVFNNKNIQTTNYAYQQSR